MKTTTLDIKENYPLRDLTTFRIGGPAKYFAAVTNESEVVEALAFAKEHKLPLFVLGGGSNILVSDNGFPGLVILNRIMGIESRIEGGYALVTAGAGRDWDDFTRRCIENNYQGIECLSGVPGTVGAAPVQNIGAYGQSADTVVAEVHAIDTQTCGTVIFNNEECGFSYRKSIFNSEAAGRYIITNVTFKLNTNARPHITYHDLKNYFSDAADVTLAGVREAVLAIRNTKGLLVLDGYDVFKSAGSFFKNPVISAELFRNVDKAVQALGGCTNWAWPRSSGEVKVSAACLIQCAGFTRGSRQGNVGISPKHTLALINCRNATASEVIAFAKQIQEKVREKFGIVIKPEVRFVGFTPSF